jgi:hypothetical protein
MRVGRTRFASERQRTRLRMTEDSEEHLEGRQFMIESFSDVTLITKILLTFLSRID